MSLTTLPSDSMIPSKTPLFGPTTKMELTLLKVALFGYSPWEARYLLIIPYTFLVGLSQLRAYHFFTQSPQNESFCHLHPLWHPRWIIPSLHSGLWVFS
jgi:hypothetical protein